MRDFEQLFTWNDGDITVEQYMERHDTYRDMNVLFAGYFYASYEGDSLVIFERNGQLYENHAGHCSCYGLEGRWSPEETSKEYLLGEIERQRQSDWKYGIIWEYRDAITKALENY